VGAVGSYQGLGIFLKMQWQFLIHWRFLIHSMYCIIIIRRAVCHQYDFDDQRFCRLQLLQHGANHSVRSQSSSRRYRCQTTTTTAVINQQK